jgi:hypothetical protein
MLTESQDFVIDPEGQIRATGDVYLYGKEVNEETYAICKSDMMIKGNDPGNIRWGSTLSTDEFAGQTFDFMLSNPPTAKAGAVSRNTSRMAATSSTPVLRSDCRIIGGIGRKWTPPPQLRRPAALPDWRWSPR